jgi:hypothetical protein
MTLSAFHCMIWSTRTSNLAVPGKRTSQSHIPDTGVHRRFTCQALTLLQPRLKGVWCWPTQPAIRFLRAPEFATGRSLPFTLTLIDKYTGIRPPHIDNSSRLAILYTYARNGPGLSGFVVTKQFSQVVVLSCPWLPTCPRSALLEHPGWRSSRNFDRLVALIFKSCAARVSGRTQKPGKRTGWVIIYKHCPDDGDGYEGNIAY